MWSWWKGWCRNNLWLKIYVQWKSKSSDAFISGQCNSVSMATSPWVFRIAALHLNLGFLFLWYRNNNTILVINQANMWCWTWNETALLTTSPAIEVDLFWNMKSTQRHYCTVKRLPGQVIQQRKNKMKYLWGLLFTSEETVQLPRSVCFCVFCVFRLCVEKPLSGAQVKILSSAD